MGGRSEVRRNAPPATPRRSRRTPAPAAGTQLHRGVPELAAITGVLVRHRVLLDGELVCWGADCNPSVASLRRRLRAPADKARRHAERAPATFLAFDVLHLDGHSTRAPCSSAFTRTAAGGAPSASAGTTRVLTWRKCPRRRSTPARATGRASRRKTPPTRDRVPPARPGASDLPGCGAAHWEASQRAPAPRSASTAGLPRRQ